MSRTVTIWNEFLHERSKEDVRQLYPDGMHATIAEHLKTDLPDWKSEVATLDMPEHGLSQELLNRTDVLLWWGHMAHDQVADEVVDRVQQRVLAGMGLLVLHSGHASKIFQRLMGTGCMLRWRDSGEKERLWNVAPGHPITAGLTEEFFELPTAEMYGEFFDIPTPDELIFISWFAGGEVFRSGCTFRRGGGRIFYFRPGHETFPIYSDANVRRVLANAIQWAAPVAQASRYLGEGREVQPPLES